MNSLRPPLLKQLLSAHQVAVDAAVTALLVAAYGVAFGEPADLQAIPRWAAAVIAVLAVVPAAWRRRWPRAVLAVTVTSGAVATALSTSPSPALAVAFVMYLIPLRFGRRDALRMLAGAGASGYLLKDTPPADLLAAIRVIAAGDALLDPGVTRRLIAEFTRRSGPDPVPSRPAAALAEITEREREVLTLVGLGLSNTEIAERLHVSMSTAKTHVGRLLMKLGARDRAQLVIAAYDAGLVSPEAAWQSDPTRDRSLLRLRARPGGRLGRGS